jgi:hypothetical protein
MVTFLIVLGLSVLGVLAAILFVLWDGKRQRKRVQARYRHLYGDMSPYDISRRLRGLPDLPKD